MKSLSSFAAKGIISKLGEECKAALLQELIDEKSEKDKQVLYQKLGDALYGGVKLSDNYVYGIFTICNTYRFIEQGAYLLNIYSYLDDQQVGEDFQIMFVDSEGSEVRFDCARVSRKINLPLGDHPADDHDDTEDDEDRAKFPKNHPLNLYYRSLVEHPEARLLYETLKLRKTKDGNGVTRNSIVVRFRDDLFMDDGNHVLIGEEWGPGLGLCIGISIGHGNRYDMDIFSEAIVDCNHCVDLEDDNYWETELEFTINIKGENCNVLLRNFECPGHYPN